MSGNYMISNELYRSSAHYLALFNTQMMLARLSLDERSADYFRSQAQDSKRLARRRQRLGRIFEAVYL